MDYNKFIKSIRREIKTTLLIFFRSGRKPRINPQVVMQQVAQQVFTPPLKKDKKDAIKKPDSAKKDGELHQKEPSTSKEHTPKSISNKKIRCF